MGSHHDEVIGKMLSETLKEVEERDSIVSKDGDLYDYFMKRGAPKNGHDLLESFFKANNIDYFLGKFNEHGKFFIFNFSSQRIDVPSNWSLFAKTKESLDKKDFYSLSTLLPEEDQVYLLEILTPFVKSENGISLVMFSGAIYLCALPKETKSFLSLLELFLKSRYEDQAAA